MMLRITTHDTAPDTKEWEERWAPFLNERETRVYWALRAADNVVDSSTLAKGAALGTNAFDRAIERLEVVGLLQTDDDES